MSFKATVIKHFSKTALLLLTLVINGQNKLDGDYSSLLLNQEYYYSFSKNGIFEYYSGASIAESEFGKGNYLIKNDSLFLNYDLTDLKENSFYKSKTYYNSKDSISVQIQVFDEQKKGLNNIYICLSQYAICKNK